jgi:predicted pyridoxine 5'-phosphate oxidase superfamily flavin-nucleotide-binding protein
MLTLDVKASMDSSVLCWLATVSTRGQPNVSPKEVFCAYGSRHILIANIASPQSVKNIRENAKVCVSFIDILVQKGYQVKGLAEIIYRKDPQFGELEKPLLRITQGNFPFSQVIKIDVEKVKPIIAPRYWLYPDTTEEEQIESALNTYRLKDYL